MRRIAYIASFVLTLVAGTAGFNAWNLLPPSVSAQQNDSERLKELGRMIDQEIGTPTANEPSQCKLIAFGSKPCGGPARYLVYSTAKTNESRLKQLVNEFNQLARKINQERKIISDCMFVTEPKVELGDGVCTIRPD